MYTVNTCFSSVEITPVLMLQPESVVNTFVIISCEIFSGFHNQSNTVKIVFWSSIPAYKTAVNFAKLANIVLLCFRVSYVIVV